MRQDAASTSLPQKKKITQRGATHSVSVHPGDFILSNSMSFGRPYILNVDGCIHDSWLRLYDLQSDANDEFLYYLLSSSYVQKQYEAFAAGSGVQNLNKQTVKKVLVYLPSVPEQRAIEEVLTAMDDEIAELEAERDKMMHIREGAMDDLLTGRVRLMV
jgi:type I restriction enzyme S subunit